MSSAAAAKPAAESKQAELAKSLSATILADLQPQLEKILGAITDNFAELTTRVCAIEARLEVIEASCSGGKKATKTSTAKGGKASTDKKSAGKKAAEDPRDKVKNSMLYFRWAWANDEEFHSTYCTDDIQDALDGDDNLAKKKDAKERRLAEGTLVWKTHLTDEQKKDVRTLFNDWSKQREKEGMDDQLDANGDADADADAAADE